ncbi:MAG: class I tRNA ligase family protein, partial [Planctomycetes bacterium]|nr:class I tRNA ligase family protein [Planctomycetota bacterium]
PRDAAIPRVAERPEIDRWLASRSESLVGEVRARMSEYDLSGACRAVEGFVVDELSNWYIRRNRRRFWKGGAGRDKQSAYATLHGALRTVALLIAPAAPFLAEMLWERLQPGDESVHAQFLPVADELVRDERLEASMRVVERVVEMGRALRERNNLRVRQPLRAIHLRASDPETLELLRSGFASELVLDELNIKSWGSLDADDGQLCTLRAKANFKTLGKRLGKQMKAAAAAIGELEPDRIAALRSGGSVALELEGETVELTAADVDVSVESRADFDVEADGRMIVFLDTELDDALLREGLAREAVNRLNGLRKQAGLAIDDRIRLNLDARGAQLGRALEEHGDFIAAETLAEAWQISKDALPGTEWSECELGDGELLRVSLARA